MCDFKNEYQKDMCLHEIVLRPQDMITIPSLIVNIMGGGGYMII